MLIVIAIGVFTSFLLFAGGVYLAWNTPRAQATRRVTERLQTWCTPRSPVHSVEIVRRRVISEVPWLNNLLAGVRHLQPLERLLAQANVAVPLGVILLLSGLLGMLGFLVGVVAQANLLLALGIATVGGSLPVFYLSLKKRQRARQFQRQLPDALELVARALHAGHAFLVGMKMVGDEFPDPIGAEFRQAVEEIGLGMDVPESLRKLSNRVESLDMKFFVTALIVQRETGGNLAEIIESIGQVIRKRFELQSRIQALSAEGRLSANVMFGLPAVIAMAIHLLNPGYLALLWTDPLGRSMVAGGLFMMCVGIIVTRKMIAIKV